MGLVYSTYETVLEIQSIPLHSQCREVSESWLGLGFEQQLSVCIKCMEKLKKTLISLLFSRTKYLTIFGDFYRTENFGG
jgi:hypothetical protein